ncbi:MAG: NAD(+)--rifampin ADP-ribosyltransferase [Acidimicrobiales bacterium]|nr:NAD(+)--rifampin ADP-ribosyltransferase [Acidimicrobiales bacterium]
MNEGVSQPDSADEWVPVTFDHYEHVKGPFFHGTKHHFAPGDLLVAGRQSNYQHGRISNNVYFAALIEPAIWGAELAVAQAADDEDARAHIYVVEPTGPYEDDPNLTNKKFPGNVTQSYRTRHPLRVVREVTDWEPHPPDVLQQMLDGLADLRARGLDVIED